MRLIRWNSLRDRGFLVLGKSVIKEELFPLDKTTKIFKMLNKSHNGVLHQRPIMLNKLEGKAIGSWSFFTFAIPNRLFNFIKIKSSLQKILSPSESCKKLGLMRAGRSFMVSWNLSLKNFHVSCLMDSTLVIQFPSTIRPWILHLLFLILRELWK